MRAIVVSKPGGDIAVADIAEPRPGPGEVSIDVVYAGCNFADTMIANGSYPHPKGYPLAMGLEPSGRIAEVGPGVHSFAVGDRVASFEEFVAATLAFAGGRGVDKIVDSTGASILDRSFGAIRKLGHVVSYGEAEGRPLPNLWERLVAKSLTFTRFHLGHVDFQSEIWQRSVEETTSAVLAGRLKTPIEDVFAFERAEAMLQRLASRSVAGKLLLAVNPE